MNASSLCGRHPRPTHSHRTRMTAPLACAFLAKSGYHERIRNIYRVDVIPKLRAFTSGVESLPWASRGANRRRRPYGDLAWGTVKRRPTPARHVPFRSPLSF
jgi:hypothetical protein